MEPKQPPKFRAVIKKYRAIGVWKWEIPDSSRKEKNFEEEETCGICLNPFESTCPHGCLQPGDECPPIRGTCSHQFHLHCIERWIESQQDGKCTMCRAPWEPSNV